MKLHYDITEDKHQILMICNLFSEYNDFDKVNNTISMYYQIEQYLDSSERNKIDKYSSDIDIDIAVGTIRMNNNPTILNKCQIYYNEGVSVYSPKSFNDASAIGGNMWTFCADNKTFQKLINGRCCVYFIHDVWVDSNLDFVAAIVKPNGFVSVHKKDGNIMSNQEYAKWKETLDTASSFLRYNTK